MLRVYPSALGVYDGNVYESLWKRAQSEPLNASEVTEGYKVRRVAATVGLCAD